MKRQTEAMLIARRADYSTSHLLHLVLSLLTIGLWVPIWILVTVSNSIERRRIDRRLMKVESDR